MFSDWTIAEKCNTLQEYSDALYNAQVEYHGKDYMLVHEELKKCAQDCESYTELGVNQGTTLATVMLQNVKKIRAIDIKLDAYNPASHLFNQYAAESNIDYAIEETSTLTCTVDKTDMMYIDTVHNHTHLLKELGLHADKAQKYIILHDTEICQGPVKLSVAIREFVRQNSHWKIVTDCTTDVGFMTIKRD